MDTTGARNARSETHAKSGDNDLMDLLPKGGIDALEP